MRRDARIDKQLILSLGGLGVATRLVALPITENLLRTYERKLMDCPRISPSG